MITAVVKQPGAVAAPQEIDGGVESIQALVGGYFEAHRLTGGYTVWCNEQGTKYMAPNIIDECHGAVLVGTVVVTRGDNGLTARDVPRVVGLLNRLSVLGSLV